MAAARKQAQPTGNPANDPDFDAILNEALAALGEEEKAEVIASVKGDAPVEIEVVKPARSRSKSSKETTPVPAKKSGAAIVPATPAVNEPTKLEVPATFNVFGLSFPTVGLVPTDRTLSELETVIEKGMDAVFNVAAALEEIRFRALYKEAGHKTFETYLKAKWGMSKSRGYQYLAASKTYRRLVEAGVPAAQLPKNEATAREFDQATKKASASQLLRIADQASAGGTKAPTAESVAKATTEVTGEQRPTTSSATTTEKAAAKASRAPRPGGGTVSSPATPRPQPVADPDMGSVTPQRGIELVDSFCNHLRAGSFLRSDTGVQARMKFLQGMIEAWLAGSKNVVDGPVARGDQKTNKAIQAEQAKASLAAEASTPATAVDERSQRKGESAIEFAVRVATTPEANFDPAEVDFAARALVGPAGLVYVKAQPTEVKAKVTAFLQALANDKKAAVKEVAKPVAPAPSAEAKELMAQTKAARPQTGTDKRRAAEAAAKKSAA